MSMMVINAAQPKELRVALWDKHLVDLEIERAGEIPTKANVYGNAIVTRVEPSLEAAFIDYGGERHGFLPLKDVSPEYFTSGSSIDASGETSEKPAKTLKVGQQLVVQIEKEARGGKGAALTTYVSLAGSYLVLMPNNAKVGGISRRIEGQERDQLKNILGQLKTPKGMGFIIRTAGLGKKLEELQWDLDTLVQHWLSIKKTVADKAETSSKRPYLLHQDGNVVIRAIRDNLREEVTEVVVDDADVCDLIKRYVKEINPGFDFSKISLYKHQEPIFAFYGIEREIEKAYQREVKLPSGGVIVIDRAEALVAIDINSSKATKASDIEQTALQTNLEAADEIARQLRLRDLGGLVVIDFIDMSSFQNQKAVENRLKDALSFDRARIQTGKISRFGLLELSRQRIKAPLAKSHNVMCPRCDGQGMIPSIDRFSQTLVRLLQQEVLNARCRNIQLYVPVDVAAYMLNESRAAIVQMESTYHKPITIVPNPNLQSPQYNIKIIASEASADDLSLPASYSLIAPTNFKTPRHGSVEGGSGSAASSGVVQQHSSSPRPAPAAMAKSGGFLAWVRRLFAARSRVEAPKRHTAPSRYKSSPASRGGARSSGKTTGSRNTHQRRRGSAPSAGSSSRKNNDPNGSGRPSRRPGHKRSGSAN